jgi:nucleotidyltransferase/DNA polymerase involved in DNA repair
MKTKRIQTDVRQLPTVEALTDEIGRIVAERQTLRAEGADHELLEENRRRLAEAQSRLSELLIERYLPDRRSA